MVDFHAPFATPYNTLCVLLAGGQGQRMGGADKGLQLHRGQTLVARGLSRLQAQDWGPAQRIGISANRHLQEYAALGHPVWADERPGYGGPLEGILSSLHHAVALHPAVHYLLVVPCDTPNIPLDLASRLSSTLAHTQHRAAAARANGRTHPLACLLSTHLASGLHDYLDNGQRKVQTWLEASGVQWVDFDSPTYPANAFDNFNTLADLTAKAPDGVR